MINAMLNYAKLIEGHTKYFQGNQLSMYHRKM